MPSRASSSSRQNVPSTSTRSLAAKRASTPSSKLASPGTYVTTPPPSRKTNPVASPTSNGSTTRLDPSSGRGALRFQHVPVDAAEALQHAQQRLPQRVLDARRAEDAHRRRRLAQQQQPGRVVDLRVGQQHAGDRRRADAVDARRRERLQLLTQVRRGVDEKPRAVGPADRQRRLRARSRPFTDARGLARPATAVPLRKPSSGGRAEDADAHGPAVDPTGGTRTS